MDSKRRRVAVVGASPKAERFSNKAVRLLRENGYEVIPINPGHTEIEGLTCSRALHELPPGSIDTVTLYVNAARSSALRQELLSLGPRRVVFNPGAENPQLSAELERQGIETVQSCSLVMIRSGRW